MEEYKAMPVHCEHCYQITRGLYQDSEQGVKEDVSVEVDAVHGETVVTEIDGCPVHIVSLNCSVLITTGGQTITITYQQSR